MSGTLQEPGWQNTTVLSGPVAAEVRALRPASGRDLGVTGSIALAHALIQGGLVDEYRLFVYPVVRGRGRRLFLDGADARLSLVGSSAFRSGVVLLTYRPS